MIKIPNALRHKLKRIPGLGDAWLNSRVTFAPRFREDGLATIHNSDFVLEPRFAKAVADCREQMRIAPEIRDAQWRWHVVAWCASHAAQVKGDFVDCGAGFGVTARLITSYLGFEKLNNRKYFMFDTFSGLDENYVTSEDRASDWNEYIDVYEFVYESFKNIKNVELIRGTIPESLGTVEINQVSFLHIDLNCVEPEVAALNHFWPKLSHGAVVLLDDYGWGGHEAQKEAYDSFAKSQGLMTMSLPTGQGLIIKP